LGKGARRSCCFLGGAGSTAGPEALQFAEDFVERLATDELHGVVAEVALLADIEDRHNVGVVQLGGGARLAVEAGKQLGILSRRAKQDFQGHAPAQRFLLRLIDHTHPAATNFAENTVIVGA
jgi:hypothetical protein